MNSEPIKGSEELAIALATPDARNYNVVPILHGEAGQGKSSLVSSIFKDVRCEILSASLQEPADFGGFPIPSESKDSIHYIPPSWALFEPGEEACIFCDDITGCNPSIQSALMRLFLEKRIGGTYVIPPSVKMVAAANPPEILGGAGHPLTLPLANRLLHIEFEMPSSTYATALENGEFPVTKLPQISAKQHSAMLLFWQMKYASFLRRFPTMISSKPNQDQNGGYGSAFASPRSIEMALRLATTADLLGIAPCQNGKRNPQASSVFLRLLQGSVGMAVAIAFSKFISEEEAASPNDVLFGNATIDYSKWRDDRIYLYFSSLAGELLKLENSGIGDIEFHLATIGMCEQIDKINACKKIDTCYASVRQLCKNGWLTRASAAANRIGELPAFKSATQKAFHDDSQLSRFVEAIELDSAAGESGNAERKRRRGRVSA